MDKKLPAIRLATAADLDEIVKLYDHARAFMRSYGNVTQWPDYYPALEDAQADLEKGVLYVAENGGAVVGTFVMMAGPDATYA